MDTRRLKLKMYLRKLVREQGRRCFWCDRWLILPEEEGHKTIVVANEREVRWVSGGIALSAGRATVDHVKPVSWGGGSHYSNLVAACYECNCDRGWMTNPQSNLAAQLHREREREYKRSVNAVRQREFRKRVEAKRRERPCKHPSYELQSEAFELWDTLTRIGIKAHWKVCPRCSRYRVIIVDRMSMKQRRDLFTKLRGLSSPLPESDLSEHGLIG